MKTTIDFIVCAKCEFACEATSSFCSNCGSALGDLGANNKARGGAGYYRDEYGWQRGEPAGDPRYSPEAEAFWSNHRVVEDELYMPTTDFLAGLIGVVGAGFAIYGVCKLIEKVSENNKLLNDG